MFAVRAVDAAGNTDPSEATRSFSADTAFPASAPLPPRPTPEPTLPTLGQLDAALLSDLAGVARDLRRIRIGRLVRRRGFKARELDALLAGRFSVTLTGTPRGSGVARKVVLAKGSRSLSTAGRYALKVKLTRTGKRLLQRDRRAKVTLTIKFRDVSGRTAAKKRSARLRR